MPLTYVHAPDASLPSLLAALRAGRTYVSSGPFLEIRARDGDRAVGEVGDSVARAARPTIEARCKDAPSAELRLVANGETIAEERALGEKRITARPRPTDTWCCAELWTAGGERLLTVTSAIYLS